MSVTVGLGLFRLVKLLVVIVIDESLFHSNPISLQSKSFKNQAKSNYRLSYKQSCCDGTQFHHIIMQLNDLEEEDDEFRNFLKEVTSPKKTDENKSITNHDERLAIKPEPGFCLKTKRLGDETTNEKIFINVCTSSQINAPREITEEELIEIVKSEDPGRYRVPVSLGEPVADLDKHGQACIIFTVIIHPDFLRRAHSSPTFMNFLLTLIYEGLETKYPQFKLDTDWIKLKNRKYMGQLTEQYIRVRAKPFIVEVDQETNHTEQQIETNSVIEKGSIPEFKIIREPLEDNPEFLIMDIQLPKVKTSKTLTLDIGTDRVVLSTRSNVYYLDIWLPINIDSDECGAQFDKATHVLTITMPVIHDTT